MKKLSALLLALALLMSAVPTAFAANTTPNTTTLTTTVPSATYVLIRQIHMNRFVQVTLTLLPLASPDMPLLPLKK